MEDIEDMFKSESIDDKPQVSSKRANKVIRSTGLRKAKAAAQQDTVD